MTYRRAKSHQQTAVNIFLKYFYQKRGVSSSIFCNFATDFGFSETENFLQSGNGKVVQKGKLLNWRKIEKTKIE